ncbi:MAG: hypothetical protein MI673_09300, partial [Thiotrichales bacterium]|nr:hypothetical protein [Thiotrichales bacterium]
FRFSRYTAIPLAAYLARRGMALGAGDHLTITNIRGERTFLTAADNARDSPEIVIGLDDERELYKLVVRYRALIERSWDDTHPTTPWMARPLGPFMHFPSEPSARLAPINYNHFALHPDGFEVTATDPFAALRSLPASAARLLFGNSAGCLTCHRFRGVGARSRHTHGVTGEPVGGTALALEDYDPAVMERFLFDQEDVAAMFDTAPFSFDETEASILLDVVTGQPQP